MNTPIMNTPMKKFGTIVAIITGLCTITWGGLSWSENYHSQFAQKDQVTSQFAYTNISILEISIREYVAILWDINFRIGEDEATSIDFAKKAEIEPKLKVLRDEVAAIKVAMLASN